VKVLRTVVDRLCKELNCVPEILTGDLTKARKPKTAAAAGKPQPAALADKKAPEGDKTAPKAKEDKKAGKDLRKAERAK